MNARFAPTNRTTLRRLASRASYERKTIYEILDEAFICHVGFIDSDHPVVVPTAYGRQDDILFVHGSVASRLLRNLANRAPACVEVTLLDGLVLARSAFHHSMNYRSVIAYGTFEMARSDEKARAMEALIERIESGRWARIRTPNRKELAATTIMSIPLTEASAKVRTGMPIEEPADM